MSIHSLIIALTATILGSANIFAAMPMRSTTVNEIKPYVYPENKPASVSVTFMPDGSGYVDIVDGKRLVVRKISDGSEISTLLDLDHTRETTLTSIEGFTLSPDASKILVWRNSEPIYRRSAKAEYFVYEVRSRLLRPLSTQFDKQRDPIFSPDSRMVAFVADGNIYCAKLDYQTEIAVTTGGSAEGILYGATDWTYEEEFSITSAMTWAPDNLNLCFLSFDQTAVPEYPLELYRGSCEPREDYALYPGIIKYRYPVAGEPNSKVKVHCYDVETRKTKVLDIPDNPEYIPFLQYGPTPEQLIVGTLNRNQNHFEIFRANPKSTVCRSIYVQESNAWIEPIAYENLWLGNDSFVVASDESGFTRFRRFSYAGADMGYLTEDGYDATDFYGIDDRGNAYYQAAAPTPLDRTVYRRDRRGIVSVIGASEGTTVATFAPDMAAQLMSYSNTECAPKYSLNKPDGTQIRVLEDNSVYMADIPANRARKEFFTCNSDGNILNGYMLKPTDFQPSRRYPVVMTQYSGPGSQSVLRKWSLDWEYYMAAKGYIVVCVDGRGTGGRGAQFRTAVYRNLGALETTDQLAAARYVASLPYVDSSRIGMCGWSFGGYETLMCITDSDAAPFAAAVAIAPVTDWRLYDTVYTERYMLTPGQNPVGYSNSAPLMRAFNLTCPVLLMYGTLDDNVHPANTLEFVSKLQSVGIFADMFVFPNMNHSINGCNARSVVYGRMCRYFMDNLK